MPKTRNFSSRVYNCCSQIPKGQISTYKYIADFLRISPREVGQVLKVNPFSPDEVPCHRVIATNFFIGGYCGEWGEGEKVATKRKLLSVEGVFFDKQGYLLRKLRPKVIFNNFQK
ncbi:Putative Methylated-DNA--[protein]-cysteine S-methyltransferase [endosymbiont DhMRE of Dentiscutata heterogama]|uniref:MGMT family protein n=1 Tax=endosymbiont DhMRE of Dentiscutata heterogama TaxID=1609546 RepID=UPI000629D3FE|nr:MGMT family protein [endosymbiont DhMRE of Dentiscutata heterogama]CFW92796.1 Putative Methylated-DNA--[protein]-cysteine S-methyltransferase [endosymbiont DhMRE of Dentiscutata heterogama]